MSYTITQKKSIRLGLNSQTFEQKVLRYTSVLLFILACVYAWALVSTVFDTAKRKTLVRENAVLSSDIAQLEAISLSNIKKLATEKELNTYALVPSHEVQYASRAQDQQVAIR